MNFSEIFSPSLHLLVSFHLALFCIFCTTTTSASCSSSNSSESERTPTITRTSDFYELLINDVYVDKTLMLEQLETNCGAVCRLTRPKGWGKSTNLNMVKRFFEIEVDEVGQPLPEDKRLNRKLFVGGKISSPSGAIKTLKPLKIAKFERVMKEQAQYPVLFVSFAHILGNNSQEITNNLKNLITKLFNDHRYLKTGINKFDVSDFDMYCAGKISKNKLCNSLAFLSRLLYEHFKRYVYILIDDYDAPACGMFASLVAGMKSDHRGMSDEEIFTKAVKSSEFRRVIMLMDNILGICLKDNDSLEKGIITGIFDLYLPDMYAGLDFDVRYGLLNPEFSDVYGFTELEVNRLLYKKMVPESERKNIKRWFGYSFLGKMTFNPWSIRQYLANDCKFGDYWIHAGPTPIVDHVMLTDGMQSLLHDLTDGKILTRNYASQISFDTIARDVNVLLQGGYLNADCDYTAEDLSVPNEEMENILKDKILSWTCGKLNVTRADFIAMAAHLAAYRVDVFEGELRKLLLAIPAPSPDVTVYHNAIMKSLMNSFGIDYIQIYSEQSNSSKPTVILISKSENHDNAVIIEYQLIQNPADLESRVELGMLEINDKLPNINIPYSHVKRILKVNLVFCGKQLALAHQIDDNNSENDDDDEEEEDDFVEV